MPLRFAMNVLYARDLQRSVDFYRALGLDVADPLPDRPVAISRDGSFTLIITTAELARAFDASWTRPAAGYRQVMEFLVDDDDAVDELWGRMIAAGYSGRTAPGHLIGPYAMMLEDPDGNAILVSNDPQA